MRHFSKSNRNGAYTANDSALRIIDEQRDLLGSGQ